MILLIIVLVTCFVPGRSQTTNQPNAALAIHGYNFTTCAIFENSTSSAFYITYFNDLMLRTESTKHKYLDFRDPTNFITFNSYSFDFDPIFDERWEKLPTYLTLDKKNHKTPKNFILSLSIWQRPNISIEFYDSNYILFKLYINVEKNNLIVKSYNYNSNSSIYSKINYVTSVDWLHITISKLPEAIELREISSTDYIQYNFTNVASSLKFFRLIHSGYPTKYKIHNYNFTALINEKNWTTIARNLKPEKYLCISLYVAMCEHCNFQIGVENVANNNNTIDIVKNVTETRESDKIKWMRFRIENKTFTENFNLLVRGDYSPEADENWFWYFDSLRMCNPDEVRYVTVERNNSNTISCKALNHPHWVINDSANITSEANCLDSQYFGPQCNIPCPVSPVTTKYEHCNVKKVCYSTNGENKCHCVVGQEASLNLTYERINYEVLLSWQWPHRICSPIFNFSIDIVKIYTDIREDNKQFNFQGIVPYNQSIENYSYKLPILPHSASYNISVLGIGTSSSIDIDVPPIRPELNENIKAPFLTPENNIVVSIPSIKISTKSKISYMYIVVGPSDHLNNIFHSCEIHSFQRPENILDLYSNNFWIAAVLEPKKLPYNFIIGDNNLMKSNFTNDTVENKPLNKSVVYSISLVAVNVYKNHYNYSFYSFPTAITNFTVPKVPNNSQMSSSSLYALLLLLVLPVLC